MLKKKVLHTGEGGVFHGRQRRAPLISGPNLLKFRSFWGRGGLGKNKVGAPVLRTILDLFLFHLKFFS